ncbi:hypothetical protein OQA88_4430 [Cercophora sp. LCS_1]
MLCPVCGALAFDELHYDWNPSGYPHHRTFAELAACTDCPFCSALHDTIKDGPPLSQPKNDDWRLWPLFLRVVPTSDAIGTEDDVSNLLVFANAPAEQGGHPIYLAMFGLFLDRTMAEWETGLRYVKSAQLSSTAKKLTCIDSREDWEREALRMGDVYRYGQLNISASAARNCHDGIFVKRAYPSYFSSAVRLPFKSARFGIGQEGRQWIYVRPGSWEMFHNEVTGSESTLASRGWVLQEALLSPRTIHYSHRQLFWECEHGTFSESRVGALASPDAKLMLLSPMPSLWSHKMILPTDPPSDVAPSAKGENGGFDISASWLRVVENYSARVLTVPADVLPALAGAASVFQKRLGGAYLAGLFRENFLESLLWKTDTPLKLRPGNLPSWSWTSLVGKVAFEINYSSNFFPPVLAGTATAKILEAYTFLPDGNIAPARHLADVNGGQLVIEGHIIEGVEMVARNYQLVIDEMRPSREQSRVLQSFIDTGAPVVGHVVMLHLGIWQWLRQRGSQSRFDRTYGALLLEATDEGRTTYKRIGIAMLKVRSETQDIELNPGDEQTIRCWERRAITVN